MNVYDYFESYLYGKLNKQELEKFEQKLKSDMDFKVNFENHKRMQMAMDILVEEDVRKHIDTIKNKSTDINTSKQVASDDTTSAKRSLVPWLVAASLAVLLCAGVFFMNKSSDHDSSYMAAYSAPIDMNATRSSNQPATTIDNYYTNTKPAHDLIEVGKYKQAAQLLEGYLSKYTGQQKQEVEWFLALAVSEFDKERSRNLLYLISTTEDHPYARKAKGLLSK